MEYVNDSIFFSWLLQNHVNQSERLCVVLGNEACDLDSTCSALIYALFLSRTKKYCATNIPMLNIDREDFAMKSEVVYFLRRFGITAKSLVFR